ncbi:hypothetical protein D9613_001880 [Agrocybe pediades]|uniref:Uncharacterized protein n=1 Tax=Agrocybe pediades TaxID=84607 RepID=A0A8H4R5B2_9AGAR|nr:hypothetical protein D9613_001880 [Agrocybe pediades]
MPALESYDVFLDLTNDMHDSVSIQVLRDYGRSPGHAVLLRPTESLTLILESGSSYQYAVKFHTKVANVTARSWKDMKYSISQFFATSPTVDSVTPTSHTATTNGVQVDRLWRDNRFNIWND